MLQNLILRTRSCGTSFITQYSWDSHFLETFCTTVVPVSKGQLGGASPKKNLHDK